MFYYLLDWAGWEENIENTLIHEVEYGQIEFNAMIKICIKNVFHNYAKEAEGADPESFDGFLHYLTPSSALREIKKEMISVFGFNEPKYASTYALSGDFWTDFEDSQNIDWEKLGQEEGYVLEVGDSIYTMHGTWKKVR